jgi:putative transposase
MDNEGLVFPQYGYSVADLYHAERNHQGKGNQLLFSQWAPQASGQGTVRCQERLGGLLKYYHREAA